MARIQLALNVTDMTDAVDFYSKLLGTGPAKLRPGYANFAVADPPLKLVLIENRSETPGSINHLGIEVDNVDEVDAAQARLAASGLITAVQNQVSCCYAVQDKVWVEGPGGKSWEIYTVVADADMPAGELRADGGEGDRCCDPSSSRSEAACC